MSKKFLVNPNFKDEDKLSEEQIQLRRKLQYIFYNRGWLRLSKPLIAVLDSLHLAVFLSYLIDREEEYGAVDTNNGWFFCTTERIESDIFFDKFQQNRCLNKLKEKELIEVKRKGIPALRHIRICWEKLQKDWDAKVKELSCTSVTSGKLQKCNF